MNKSVLVIDDHPTLRKGIQRILDAEPLYCKTYEAATLCEARVKIDAQAWDAIILDISLPDGSGLDLIEEVRREDPKTPILILSVHLEPELVHSAIQLGASGYLKKDSAVTQLKAVLCSLWDGKSSFPYDFSASQ